MMGIQCFAIGHFSGGGGEVIAVMKAAPAAQEGFSFPLNTLLPCVASPLSTDCKIVNVQLKYEQAEERLAAVLLSCLDPVTRKCVLKIEIRCISAGLRPDSPDTQQGYFILCHLESLIKSK